MKTIFILSLILAAYSYFIYPLILWIASILFGKRVKKAAVIKNVSLIISAYNEEDIIEKKLKNSLKLDYPVDKLEIIVASEAVDGTNDIVRRYAEKGVKLFSYAKREGKAATLYRAVPETSGEILVFSDANAMYERDAIRKLVQNFADDRIGCVSGVLQYKNPSGASAGRDESRYWRYEIFLKKIESKLFALLGANGSIFALRRKAYLPLNKYRGDDFELPINSKIEGFGSVLEPAAISYEEGNKFYSQEFKRKVRIVSWNFESALLLLRRALQRKRYFVAFLLLSHKILRWWLSLFLVFIFLSSLFLVKSGGLYAFFFIIQAIFYSVALTAYLMDKYTGKRPDKPLSIPYYFCMVNVAASIGLFKSLSNRTESLWNRNR